MQTVVRELQMYAVPHDKAAFVQTATYQRLQYYQTFPDSARLPIVIMPDVAPDVGLPVGSCLTLYDTFIPFAIGSDPGCGYGCWLLRNIQPFLSPAYLTRWIHLTHWNAVEGEEAWVHALLQNQILQAPPETVLSVVLSRKLHPLPSTTIDPESTLGQLHTRIVDRLSTLGMQQRGQLAPGNHYVELHKFVHADIPSIDAQKDLLLIIHNGSLGLGKLVQQYGLRLAGGTKALQAEDLPYLALQSASIKGQAYRIWLQYAMEFAYLNRAILAARAISTLQHSIGQFETVALSDDVHSGIVIEHQGPTTALHHLSGAQILHDLAFVGGRVGGCGFMVQAGSQIAQSRRVIGHGSSRNGMSLSDGQKEDQLLISNLKHDELYALGTTFHDAQRTIDLLAQEQILTPVAQTKPIALIKYLPS